MRGGSIAASLSGTRLSMVPAVLCTSGVMSSFSVTVAKVVGKGNGTLVLRVLAILSTPKVISGIDLQREVKQPRDLTTVFGSHEDVHF